MAGNTVNIDLNIRSNGSLKEHVKDSDKYADNLARANREGARAASMQYGRARGVAGVTGASARNFANEQQGLGGLVQLYAKIAANTYAAAAAFNILKGALDTTTMVEGLNQLGARSGVALGTLAQNLVKATGGAISLREAMQATAQGTGAGLSSGQMLKLADTAKKASQVLGIDMSDALSRLSRGVTKLEPELLDELGIFTKIGPATEAYARSIGKTTASLTDFERRQAFANAVLKEGQEKFGSIDIPTNPYDQLLASLKNVSQSFLEIVNKVFVPFASLLANNSGLLIAAVAAVAAKISTSLFPILGSWQQRLADTADLTKKKATDIAGSYGENFVQRVERSRQIPQLTQQLAQGQTDSAKAMQDYLASTGNKSAFTKGLRGGGDFDIQAAKARLSLIEREKTAIDSITGPLTVQQAKKQQAYDAEIKSLKDLIKLKGEELLLQTRLTQAQEASVEIASVGNLSADARDKNMKRAIATSERWALLSKVVQDTQEGGFGSAREKLKTGLDDSKNMGKIDKMLTGIGGTAVAAATEVATLAEAFGPLIFSVGTAAVTAFIALDSVLSNNSKEITAFTEQLNTADEAIANADRTARYLEKQGGLVPVSMSGIKAISNALNEINSSIGKTIDLAEESKKAMSNWDAGWNFLKKFYGGDIDTKATESIAKQIKSGLNLLKKTDFGEEAQAEVKRQLNISTTDVESIEKGLKKLGTEGGPLAEKIFEKINNTVGSSHARLEQFRADSDAVKKAYDELIQSTANSDPLFKVGAALIQINKTSKAMTGSISDLKAVMIDLAQSPEKGMLFGPEFIGQLVAMKDTFLEQEKAAQKALEKIADLREESEKLKKQEQSAQGQAGSLSGIGVGTAVLDATNARNKRQQEINAEIARLQDERSRVPKQFNEILIKGLNEALSNGSKMLETALGNAAERASITLGRAELGRLSGARKAAAEGALNEKELNLQREAIVMNSRLILSQDSLKAAIEKQTAAYNLTKLRERQQSDTGTGARIGTFLGLREPVKDSEVSQTVGAFIEATLNQTITDQLAAGKININARKRGQTREDKVNEIVEQAFKSEGFKPEVLKDISEQDLVLAKQRVALQVMGQSVRLGQQQAALTGVNAQSAANVNTTQQGVKRGSAEDQQKLLSAYSGINQALVTRAGLMNNNLEATTSENLQIQDRLELESQSIKNRQDLLRLDADIALARNKEEKTQLENEKSLIVARQAQETTNLKINQTIREINRSYLESNTIRQEEFKNTQALFNLEKQRLSNQQGLLGALQEAGAITGEFYAKESNRLALAQNEVDYRNATVQATETLREVESQIMQQRELAGAAMIKSSETLLNVTTNIKNTFEDIAGIIRGIVGTPGSTTQPYQLLDDHGNPLADTQGLPRVVIRDNTLKLSSETETQSAKREGAQYRFGVANLQAYETKVVQDQITGIRTAVALERNKQQLAADKLSVEIKTLDVQKQLNDLSREGFDYLSSIQIQSKQQLETTQLDLKQRQDMAAIKDKEALARAAIAEIEKTDEENRTEFQVKALQNSNEQLQLYKEQTKALGEIQKGEKDLLRIQQAREPLRNIFAKENLDIESLNKVKTVDLNIEKDRLNVSRQVFDASFARTRLTADQVIQLEKQRKLEDADLAYKISVKQINDDIATQSRKNYQDYQISQEGYEEGNIAGAVQWKERQDRIKQEGEANLKLAEQIKDGAIKAADAQSQYTARQKAYEETISNSFERMGDAIANFVETGKWNFKSLINSLLADLLRWEMKNSFKNLFGTSSDMIGSGGYGGALIGGAKAGYNFLSSFLNPYSDRNTFNALMAAGGLAKGGVFDQGYPMHKFAMGGSFTNSIVSSPTMFKFAQGTGLMGEAGPEAIMPLRRGSNGSLGVQAQPSNVNVVINNSTGQPAQTRESMDSRGNRTIEVMVGDMVAQQMATKNSSVQQTMAGVYGTRPAVSRR